MSYSCQISFKQIKGDDIFDFFKKLKNEASQHLENIAEDNYVFSPLFKDIYSLNENFTIDRDMKLKIEDWTKSSIFTYRYFYDKENEILGVYSISDCLTDLFDCTVYFQDSCDQNYDFDEWNGIKLFEKIAQKWSTSSDENIISYYEKEFGKYDSDDAPDLDYCRKSFAYDEIWKMVSKTLYDETDVVYLSLYSYYDFESLNKFSHYIQEKTKKWINDTKDRGF